MSRIHILAASGIQPSMRLEWSNWRPWYLQLHSTTTSLTNYSFLSLTLITSLRTRSHLLLLVCITLLYIIRDLNNFTAAKTATNEAKGFVHYGASFLADSVQAFRMEESTTT